MRPSCPLPLPERFQDPDEYVESLLEFGTTSELLQSLCGGVHILDFFTRTPDLYSLVLPHDWRDWFKDVDIMDFLDLLMREDLDQFNANGENSNKLWRGNSLPPSDLVRFIRQVRTHSLNRAFAPPPGSANLARNMTRQIAVGMKVKKVHEVALFSHWVDSLTKTLSTENGQKVSHLVDFGSGQNYLGRALASEPFNQHIIAVESRSHNVEGARRMDIHAKLAPKPRNIVNKKAYRASLVGGSAKRDVKVEEACDDCDKLPSEVVTSKPVEADVPIAVVDTEVGPVTMRCKPGGSGAIQYIEHRILDGDLGQVIERIIPEKLTDQNTADGIQELTIAEPKHTTEDQQRQLSKDLSLMVISLHSCGNLLHHGLRSLVLNPSVHAVALIGCCYNLLTERLGPPTFKIPSLRTNHPRLEETSNAFDPHGFPMSNHLVNYQHKGSKETGIRLNITARMMAVQAPQNWGREDSEVFFSRHFFRALLQRIFLDRGVVTFASSTNDSESSSGFLGLGDSSGGTQPIILGSLRKACYQSFVSYVRGAIEKLSNGADANQELKQVIQEKMGNITDDEIREYEERYQYRKKELSVIWSLMAFSAGVIESIIVVDRWLWLREQKEVKDCWVEPVFEYRMSPRNLVVVGIK